MTRLEFNTNGNNLISEKEENFNQDSSLLKINNNSIMDITIDRTII